MKTVDDTYMNHFLTNTHCFRTRKKATDYIAKKIPFEKQVFNDKCGTLKRYESHGFVVYKNVLLEQTFPNVADMPYKKLSLTRSNYLSEIIGNLEKLFPIELLSEVDIFDNRYWDDTKNVEEEHQGDEQKLRKLCAFYGLPYRAQVFQSWIKLIKDLFEQGHPWCDIRHSYPSAFWMNVLGSNQFEIHSTLARLIKSVIVTPMGSSEAERSFSIMNKVYR